MGQSIKKLHVVVGDVKRTIKARVDTAAIIGKKAGTSAFVQSHPPVQDACNTLVVAGVELADADTAVKAAEAELAQLRTLRDTKAAAYDSAYSVCVAQTEHFAKTPDDIQSVGFDVSDRASHDIAPPVGVRARFDAGANVLRIEVDQAPGIKTYLVEVSTNPNDPTSWKRIPGTGVRRKLSDLAPGVYWIRAASARASEESEFTSPIAVTVK
jgi:hypothetical protein